MTRAGGVLICSINGTTGYLDSGAGVAFDLSTFNNWFQIDLGGINLLTSTQSLERSPAAINNCASYASSGLVVPAASGHHTKRPFESRFCASQYPWPS